MRTRSRSKAWTVAMAVLVVTVVHGAENAAPAGVAEVDLLLEQAQAALDGGDAAEARALVEAAAATGAPEAINALGTYISAGIGGTADPRAARALFEQAVAKGSVGARLNLGKELIHADDVNDRQRGVALLSELHGSPSDGPVADQVRRLAAGHLGAAFMFGLGVTEDAARAVGYLEEADATGEGGPPDASRGWAYLMLAARSGDEVARDALDRMKADVDEASRSEAEGIAARWIEEHGEPLPDD